MGSWIEALHYECQRKPANLLERTTGFTTPRVSRTTRDHTFRANQTAHCEYDYTAQPREFARGVDFTAHVSARREDSSESNYL